MSLRGWLVSLLLCAGCVTPEQEVAKFKAFPETFRAQQRVTVFDGKQNFQADCLMTRNGDVYEFSFREPFLQVELLKVRKTAEGIDYNWNPSLKPPKFKADQVVEKVIALYSHEPYETVSATEYKASIAELKVALSSVKDREGCLFPSAIRVVSEKEKDAMITIETKEVRCTLDRT